MRARKRHWVWGIVLVGIALPGCSTTCGWFGRNSDCSNNCIGKKPMPVQQGPLGGTYTQPGNGTMTAAPLNYQQNAAMAQPNGTFAGQTTAPPNMQAPVITTSPATTVPNAMPPSPLNTPFNAPPTGMTPQAPTLPGTPVSVRQLPPAEFNPNPSATMAGQTGPVVKQPEVPPPPIDLTVPGTSAKKADMTDPAVKPSAFPLVLAPNDGDRSVRTNGTNIAGPNVPAPPSIPVPTIPVPNTSQNTNSTVPMTPPPLPATPPAPPRLD